MALITEYHPLTGYSMSKKRDIGRMIARGNKLVSAISETQTAPKSDLEILSSPPKNRTEAKRQLAIKLRLLKSGAFDNKSLRALEGKASLDLSVANALRFDDGVVDSVATDKIPESQKRWRGRTAD